MHLVVSSRDADTSTFFFYLYHCVDAGEASTIWSSSACKYVLKAGSSSMRLMSPARRLNSDSVAMSVADLLAGRC